MFVHYGTRIRLKHVVTGHRLHSHPINYGQPGTSGQQQVTAYEKQDDNDFWVVKGPHGVTEVTGEGRVVRSGDVIRLEHFLTRRNLHSHLGFPSPVTRQQEVTCYGDTGAGDSNDQWRVEVEGGGWWNTTKRVRLIHVNTNAALHSHAGFAHPQWTANQQEVTGFAGRDDNDWWIVSEEAYCGFPVQAKANQVRDFAPSTWGLHFRNNFGNLPLRTIDVAGQQINISAANAGRCGGMVFAACDYFNAGQLVPPQTNVPGTESPLFNYIADRLLASFNVAQGVPLKYMHLMNPALPNHETWMSEHGLAPHGRAWVMIREEWPQIKADLDAGRLCPLALVLVESINPLDLGKNHVVLAYGYTLRGNDLSINVYDPNCPNDDTQRIRLNIGDPAHTTRVSSTKGYRILCFFRLHYSAETPPALPVTSRAVRLKAHNGSYLGAAGGTLKATFNATSPEARFTMQSLRPLQNGDCINLRASTGKFVVAESAGGGVVNANRDAARQWETFFIKRVRNYGSIGSGDQIALRAHNGQFVCAEGGGGGIVNANRDAVGVWETFTIEFV